MGIDLRLPVGMMFSLLGLLLCGYGLATRDAAMYQTQSLGININLWWGIALSGFGGTMLLWALGGRRRVRPST